MKSPLPTLLVVLLIQHVLADDPASQRAATPAEVTAVSASDVSVRGQLLWEDGTPAAHQKITIVRGGDSSPIGSWVTDDDGRYCLSPLHPHDRVRISSKNILNHIILPVDDPSGLWTGVLVLGDQREVTLPPSRVRLQEVNLPSPPLHPSADFSTSFVPGKIPGTFHFIYQCQITFTALSAFPVNLVLRDLQNKEILSQEVNQSGVVTFQGDVPPGQYFLHSEVPSGNPYNNWGQITVFLRPNGKCVFEPYTTQLDHRLRMKVEVEESSSDENEAGAKGMCGVLHCTPIAESVVYHVRCGYDFHGQFVFANPTWIVSSTSPDIELFENHNRDGYEFNVQAFDVNGRVLAEGESIWHPER